LRRTGGEGQGGWRALLRLQGGEAHPSEGKPVRGERKINEAEAVVVRRIFREFAAGKSPRAIATDLNRDGIPGPFGRTCGDMTIRGQPGQWRRQQRALCWRPGLESTALHQGPEYG